MQEFCDNCKKSENQNSKDHGTWWTLSNYYNISGYFCPDCYELVSHDAYGNPIHRKEWAKIAVKQRLQNTNKRKII